MVVGVRVRPLFDRELNELGEDDIIAVKTNGGTVNMLSRVRASHEFAMPRLPLCGRQSLRQWNFRSWCATTTTTATTTARVRA